MNKTVIDNIVIEGDYKSISVVSGKIFVDGKLYKPNGVGKDEDYHFSGPLIINGNVKTVDGTNITVNGDVVGDVDGTNITVFGNVSGDVDGTNVTIKKEAKHG